MALRLQRKHVCGLDVDVRCDVYNMLAHIGEARIMNMQHEWGSLCKRILREVQPRDVIDNGHTRLSDAVAPRPITSESIFARQR